MMTTATPCRTNELLGPVGEYGDLAHVMLCGMSKLMSWWWSVLNSGVSPLYPARVRVSLQM